MGIPRHIRKLVARETLLALLVVALTFLSFGHASVSVGSELKFAPDVWCGDPLLPARSDHAPCHACRIGSGADVPPPPAMAAPVSFAAMPVSYVAPLTTATPPITVRPLLPRGPPILV